MWSDRDDEDELPAEPPQLGLPAVMIIAAVLLIGLSVVLALLF